MSRKADCWDNPVGESFFATLEKQSLDEAASALLDDARAELFEYIEVFYNRQRRHFVIGYMTPAQFELVNSVQLAGIVKTVHWIGVTPLQSIRSHWALSATKRPRLTTPDRVGDAAASSAKAT